MARQFVVSMSAIIDFFEEKESIRKGFVYNMVYDEPLHASMKNKTYKVEIVLNDGQIKNCPKGLGICHHMAALAIFGHSNLSVTAKACSWNKPKRKGNADLTAEECFPSITGYNVLNQAVDESSISKFAKDLKLCGPTGLSWILAEEPITHEKNIVNIEDVIFTSGFTNALIKREYLTKVLQISNEEIIRTNKATVGQRKNSYWLMIRKHRLTASNFGKIIKACRRSRFPTSLFQTLTGSYGLSGIKQIQWGRNNERVALQLYTKHHNKVIVESGIWLHTCGILGVSPDGLLDDDTVIEVKCPYKYRNDILAKCILHKKDHVVSSDGEKYIINKDHDYYHQIQGQLHITKRQKCILILWTSVDYLELPIEKDEQWAENLNILIEFYFNQYINYICNPKDT